MPRQLKNNKFKNNDSLVGDGAHFSTHTKLPRELETKKHSAENNPEAVQGRPKLVTRFYKRIKRVGIWCLSFVSSFLCGAFVVFILW